MKAIKLLAFTACFLGVLITPLYAYYMGVYDGAVGKKNVEFFTTHLGYKCLLIGKPGEKVLVYGQDPRQRVIFIAPVEPSELKNMHRSFVNGSCVEAYGNMLVQNGN
jgi:hypothetical protein